MKTFFAVLAAGAIIFGAFVCHAENRKVRIQFQSTPTPTPDTPTPSPRHTPTSTPTDTPTPTPTPTSASLDVVTAARPVPLVMGLLQRRYPQWLPMGG